jgi:hypothetical protein
VIRTATDHRDLGPKHTGTGRQDHAVHREDTGGRRLGSPLSRPEPGPRDRRSPRSAEARPRAVPPVAGGEPGGGCVR